MVSKFNNKLTSQRPSPSPKSKPKIPKSQIQKVKGDFCLWALTEVFWANHHTTPFTELSILITNIVLTVRKDVTYFFVQLFHHINIIKDDQLCIFGKTSGGQMSHVPLKIQAQLTYPELIHQGCSLLLL